MCGVQWEAGKEKGWPWRDLKRMGMYGVQWEAAGSCSLPYLLLLFFRFNRKSKELELFQNSKMYQIFDLQ